MRYSGSCESCEGVLLDLINGGSNYGCDSNWPDADNKIVLMAYNDSKGCPLYTKVKCVYAATRVSITITGF